MRILICLFLGVWTLAACQNGSARQGAMLYAQACAGCHGPEGAGDGAKGADLPVPAPDLRQLAQRHGGAFPTAPVMAKIHGYRGRDLDGLMPAFGPALTGPDLPVTLADGTRVMAPAGLVALTRYLETLQEE